MNRVLIDEAKILIGNAYVALDEPNPDIDAIRAMLKEADELLAGANFVRAPTEAMALPQGVDWLCSPLDPLSAGRSNHGEDLAL